MPEEMTLQLYSRNLDDDYDEIENNIMPPMRKAITLRTDSDVVIFVTLGQFTDPKKTDDSQLVSVMRALMQKVNR